MKKFWVLDADGDQRLADWPEDEKIEFRKVTCTVNPSGHRGVRERITTPLSLALPSTEVLDFVWDHLGAFAVKEHALQILQRSGLSGFEAVPARVRFARSLKTPPKLWELVVTGSAGRASSESGLRVVWRCPGCDLSDYSRITDPTKVVDESRWDGSDFFRVEPLSGWTFVTDKAVRVLRASALTGWKATPLEEMQSSFDVAVAGSSHE